jgi:hypothetical protein
LLHPEDPKTMKNLMNRFAIVSAAILTSATTIVSAAAAAPITADVTFNGNIPAACTFSNITPGTIGKSKTNNTDIGSNSDYYQNGNKGIVGINCSGNAALTIADPVQTAGPTTTTNNSAVVYVGNQTIISPSGNGNFVRSGNIEAAYTQDNITVSMDANGTTALESGNYTYKVTLTATPN